MDGAHRERERRIVRELRRDAVTGVARFLPHIIGGTMLLALFAVLPAVGAVIVGLLATVAVANVAADHRESTGRPPVKPVRSAARSARLAVIDAVSRPAPPLSPEERVRCVSATGRRAARELLHEIETAKLFIRQYFREVPERVRILLAKYAALCRRLVALEQRVDEDELARLEEERARVAGRAAGTGDAVARAGFERAAGSLERTIESLEKIGRDAERIEAQLAYIEAELESARARVIRIKATAAADDGGDRRAVARAVEAIDAEVEALSQAVDEVFGETGGVPELPDMDLAASLDGEEEAAEIEPEAESAPAAHAARASPRTAPAGALPLVEPSRPAAAAGSPRRQEREETARRRRDASGA
jgi:hypothetical protein